MLSKKVLIGLWVVLLSLPSCLNEEVCEDVATVPVRLGFYIEPDPDDPLSDEPIPVSIDSITIYGVGNDSIIYNNTLNASQIELPLNSLTDSSGFVFRFPQPADLPQRLQDTLWLYYQTEPFLISLECGFITFYELTDIQYTNTFIDTIEIDNISIINTLDEHIKIFPHTVDNK